MPAAAPGVTETGAPSFVVLGPEAIGLSNAPTDLHLLPDGRVLVVSPRELAFGDGVRWEVYRAAPTETSHVARVVVDADGRIYTGIRGAIARIELDESARWHATPVVALPSEAKITNSTMISVAVIGDDWYWHAGAGAIVAWRPNQPARVVGNANFAIERIFALGAEVFISDRSSGALVQLMPDGQIKPVPGAETLTSETVSCATPFAPGRLLVGRGFWGPALFDGTAFHPFDAPGVLRSGRRMTDLCAATDNVFAAAIDTVGIVFFDRDGHTLQVLERALDHRLAHVRRLQYSPRGVLWALLNEGIARVQFPSPVSHFEPLIANSLGHAEPLRHRGRLWVLADGRAVRGVYDEANRLERFETDSPPGAYLFTLAEVDGQLMASNERGIFVRGTEGWNLVLPGIVNARLGAARTTARGSLYVARGEFGFLQRTPDGFTARRIPVEGLADNYNGFQDAAGIAWFELGTSLVARVDPNAAQPSLQILGRSEGLTDGWVESYLFEGVARFHLPDRVFRFDAASGRFVDDHDLLRRLPHLAQTVGRPITDPSGRLWYTADGLACSIDLRAPGGEPQIVRLGFAPTLYKIEEDGVVWMFESRRLARFDPRVSAPPAPLPRAIITSVKLSEITRHLVYYGSIIEPLDYANNSPVINFAAPANPFTSPVTFEVLMEGAGAQWVSTGTVGSAAFNRLKEGDYVFRVRPVVAGTVRGEEARLKITILPPWYRTPLAWTLYVAAAAGVLGVAIWGPAYLQQRETERLERLVAERTGALNATNQQLGRQIEETTEKSTALAASEERYRTLNSELEQRVQQRTAELSSSNQELARRESLFRLIFEHAPVGISWKRADLGSVYHLNPTYRRILDLPADTLTDYTLLSDLVHPDDAHRQAEMHRLIASGLSDSYEIEERFVLPSGRVVWGSLSVAVIRDPEGRIVQDIGILEDITARKDAEQELANTYKNLVEASRMAGMAEVATGVLHNVGNVLNNLNVSAGVLATRVAQSKVEAVRKLSALLDEHSGNLAEFFAHDPKAQFVPGFVDSVAKNLLQDRDWVLQEIAAMQKNIDHIKDIVAMQQGYATVISVVETLDAPALFDEALRISATTIDNDHIKLNREFLPLPAITVEKSKVLQILINLIRNAKIACGEAGGQNGAEPAVTLRLEPAGGERVKFIVRDNGIGIPAKNLTCIFGYGFTTRPNGRGFGLHSSALAAAEIGGSLKAESEGPGRGATFTLELPTTPGTKTGANGMPPQGADAGGPSAPPMNISRAASPFTLTTASRSSPAAPRR